ncbi:phosphoribosyltransferase [Phytohabitans kaempferiae]|uniref:Phosphoribosyltransferase n=1 Tax=Phytohabitans kaempferiae TaxID=1620943 RepID=A0ABV6M8V5_9ACTN
MIIIDNISIVVGIFASIVTILASVNFVRERTGISWKTVDTCTKQTITAIQQSGFHPELVVGVGRGGAILAGMLAGNLGHVPLFVVDTVLDRSDGMSTVHVRFPNLLPDLDGKRVLLAVGELYSGEDLRAVLQTIKATSPTAQIKTVSLFTHPATSIKPDFVGRETRQPLSAPWRMSDVYRARRL